MTARTKAIILILISFVIGLGIGIFIDRMILLKVFDSYSQRGSAYKRYRTELIERLKLNSKQQVQLDSILSWSRGKFKALTKEFHSRITVIRNEVRDSIRKILTSEQREEFERMIKEYEKKYYRED
jgi:hypothetical protein